MTDNNQGNKSAPPPAGKNGPQLPKLPQLGAPNMMGLKPLSPPGAAAKRNSIPVVPALPQDQHPSSMSSRPAIHAAAPRPAVPAAPPISGMEEEENAGATQSLAQPTAAEIADAMAVLNDAAQGGSGTWNKAAPVSSDSAVAPVGHSSNLPAIETPSVPAIDASAEAPNDDEEEEEEENVGEKTMMLDIPMDDGDGDGEKTQITMSAMDFEPLSGKLIIESGKASQREYILVRDKTQIGRGPKNEIVISDISMSRQHVCIDKFREGFRIRDLDSGNGTMLNGHRIRVGQLRDGDSVEMGNIRFRFEQSGGDPDELWKGPPKIEYHPNQSKNSLPSLTGGAQSQNAMPPVAAYNPPPQMEPMIQRQGGGIAAPAWIPPAAAAMPGMPMTSPYMMSYGAANLKSVSTTPAWAIVMISVAGLILVGSLVFFAIALSGYNARLDQNKAQAEAMKNLKSHIEHGVTAYAEKRLKDARQAFASAKEVSADNPLADTYIRIIAQEDDINNEISRVRRQSRNMTADELEAAIQYFRNVSPDSIYFSDIQANLLPLFTGDYVRRLKNDIRERISSENITEARRLIAKLSIQDGTAGDVRAFNKLIDDIEKVNR
ncbi:MAG: FHA domain-containing protein [Proteobacteria bacterium]|nr:FHA domain-containing protein [Pseudomonadota bacterium]